MPSSPFPDQLLTWWDRHGRKDLPWQQPRSPYRVWVSEVMLQQTQVSTVVAYFERWMDRFPRLTDLAEASEDEVMGLWSGLGYYSRARNLHKAARICLERFDGRLPDSTETLMELPGIGKSTANAIISLAFNRPAAILDGNVKRVLARHAQITGWPGQSQVLKQLWEQAELRLPTERSADYSQAIMDLGALVCTRSNPECDACPISKDCGALLSGTVDGIPAARPKKKIPDRTVHLLVVQDEYKRVLLERRPPSGIWGGLWSLPEEEAGTVDFTTAGGTKQVLPEFDHRLTHIRLRLKPVLVTIAGGSGLECHELRDNRDIAWFGPKEWTTLGLPKPISNLLHHLEENITA